MPKEVVQYGVRLCKRIAASLELLRPGLQLDLSSAEIWRRVFQLKKPEQARPRVQRRTEQSVVFDTTELYVVLVLQQLERRYDNIRFHDVPVWNGNRQPVRMIGGDLKAADL